MTLYRNLAEWRAVIERLSGFDQSVVIANAASKAKQRAAVDEVVRQFKNVFYFPSFEMVLADPSSFEADTNRVATAPTRPRIGSGV